MTLHKAGARGDEKVTLRSRRAAAFVSLSAVIGGALAAGLLAGCTVSELDLEGRACPCIAGWVCDESRDVCVRGDAGTAGVDAGDRDATSPEDAGDRDAGEVDAGSDPDGGPVGDPTGCDDDHADALFCDGFEGGDFSLWDDLSEPTDTSVTVTSDVVYRGTTALRVEVLPTAEYAGVGNLVFPTPAPPDQYLRAYYYFPSDSSIGVETMEMTNADWDYNYVMVVADGYWDLHSHGWTTDFNEGSSYGVPRDTWVCIEMHAHFSATEGAVDLWVDGTEVVSRSGLELDPPNGLGRIDVGVVYHSLDDPTTVVYVDEVVADTSPIGCD